nr:hypothetical protein [Croceivirga thetidis]
MFSTGQLIFALLFVIAFVLIIVFAYKKDTKLHQKNYKGAKWVLVSFVIFIIFLFLVKGLLKN